MTDYVGLTWDHPRGRDALERASGDLGGGDTIRWEAQPLEGFESAPIDELCARYDLVVLDHPHLGDALEAGCIRALDEVFEPDDIAAWRTGAVGQAIASYTMDGRLWALPLDAATQVSARRSATVPDAPTGWDELPERTALSLAGPHAFLTLCSVALSFGGDPFGGGSFGRDTGLAALGILQRIAERAPAGSETLNPIGLLDRMRDAGDIDYIPLVFGYVNYSSASIRFGAPPAGVRGGSVLGGTGIALSSRAEVTPALAGHLRWLLSPEAQAGFIPGNAGQPGLRSAWRDPAVDEAAHGFYSATLDTIEGAWIRPRFAGYVPFQQEASRIVREALAGSRPHAAALDDIDARYRAALKEDA
ncbi:membrane protein [Microbacterium sorbitolivorans]|uniref:Carbohydrate ABC transporter substrate-binding protein n=1 Tax=Microbacterium sorbitolivorans TaxID=1867410 RepID=A0A367XYJ1_9MICO|nr:carbohydrate ABC transporter substrate-binding protein [Microbacterium sorbitolivorans]RCK58340.1 carbohydrate ABC transporter substrate-binding protein [Microbacterium sorbitolivorans]GGF35686.1 membrane protein [Microbacterium sorbitolivorans]